MRAGDENEEEEEEKGLEETMRKVASSTASRRTTSKQQILPKIPESVDDFLRNFLRRAGLSRTLSSFEAEWYGSVQRLLTETLSMAGTGVLFIPDALTHRQLLQAELETVRSRNDQLRQDVLAAGQDLVRMRRERDFHQLQHRRVTEDKNRLMEDVRRLKGRLDTYEPTLKHLEDQYKAVFYTSQKVRDQNTKDARLNQDTSRIKRESGIKRSDGVSESPAKSTTARHPKDTEFPVVSRTTSPHLVQVEGKRPNSFSLSYSITAHKLPISCIDLHPHKPVLASASDDCSWRLWLLQPNGEKVGQMLLTGDGHSEPLSGCSFHPDGEKLATTGGDSTVRLWDFSRGCCVLTLSGHSRPTRGCSFHPQGHFLASCSADRTAKLWDLNSQRCRLTLRRHTASVNSVCFLPSSSTLLLLTCSADKTLAMWDARLGVCTALFRGHQHPCNHGTFSRAVNLVASCDSCGKINLWDIRKPTSPMATVDLGPLAANKMAFSPSGKTLAVAGSDSLVRLVEVESCVVSSLEGHGDIVQSVTFDHKGENVMSAGRDGIINVWT